MTPARWLTTALAVIALGACTNEKLVYVNRQFNPPADSKNGFLGYFDETTQQTSCGNCHVEHQGEWKNTKHASAWADLQALAQPADKSSCEGCHSVSQYGNTVSGNGGYLSVKDASYHDVQCENCHGPGADHASVPDAGTAPLARISADTGVLSAGTCGACHSGTHHPFVEEWKQSIHALNGRHADEAECQECHTGQGALEAWGVTSAYVGSEDPITAANGLGITCAVCHDPHDSKNTAQLRWPLETNDPSQNLCMKCHYRRTVPLALDSTSKLSPGGSNSPHAPQGATLIGEVGYQNPSYLDPVLVSVAKSASHGNLAKNPKLCAGCHLYSFSAVNDAGVASTVTGHLFRPIPCYGPDGLPTDSIKTCAYTPGTPGTAGGRSFKACAQSGCHLGENEAAGLLAVARGRIQTLTAALLVNTGSSLNAIDTLDSGIIPAVLRNTWSQRGTLNNLSLLANGAFLLGDSIVNLDAATVTGKLAAGNTIRIGTTVYTVTADVTAATNKLNGVHITPALTAPLADNTPVFVVFMAPLLAGDRVITAMDGAEFNVRTFGENAAGDFVIASGNTDRSHTVHNPFLAEALLRANIEELTALYGSQPWFPVLPPAVRAILAGPVGASGSVPFPRPAVRRASR
ncbi:MAG TPA: multiheme c-type cytochrome [Gemmatimonadales bacterium]